MNIAKSILPSKGTWSDMGRLLSGSVGVGSELDVVFGVGTGAERQSGWRVVEALGLERLVYEPGLAARRALHAATDAAQHPAQHMRLVDRHDQRDRVSAHDDQGLEVRLR